MAPCVFLKVLIGTLVQFSNATETAAFIIWEAGECLSEEQTQEAIWRLSFVICLFFVVPGLRFSGIAE